MKVLPVILEIIIVFLELLFLLHNEGNLIKIFDFLGTASVNKYEEIFINLLASIIFSGLQFFNLFIVKNILIGAKIVFINVIQKIFKFRQNDIEEYQNKMVQFLFSCQAKWGSSLHSNTLRNANTAEVLIACASIIESGRSLTDPQLNDIKSILDRVLFDLSEDGYKSISQDVYTVHCTAMMLYAIKKYIDLNVYEIDEQKEDLIRKCLRKLLTNANQEGWGFINKKYSDISYNRSFSTIWALRALNIWGLSENKTVRDLSVRICNTNGIIGYCRNDTEHYSVTALLYLYVLELKEGLTKRKVLERINHKKIYKYLIAGLKKETESEEFFLSIEDNKKLSWTHFSWCLITQVLSYNYSNFNVIVISKIILSIKNQIKNIDSNFHCYKTKSIRFAIDDPLSYPTAYLIMALSGFLRSNTQ